MSADELVVRLQATLDEIEQAAQDAIDHTRGGDWSEAPVRPTGWGDQDPDVVVLSGGKPIATFNVEYGGAFAAVHAIGNDPRAVLRLVQAHRDILDKLARTKRLLDEANERVLQQVMDGTVSTRQEQRDFDSLHVEEAVLAEVVEDLARGYGLEDDHE